MGGRGEAVVFLHGDSLDHRQWNQQCDFISKNYQVITYDLRGYGRSCVPTKSFSHVADLKILLNKLNIKKAHLVGSSFGGEQAVNFVLTYPELVKSLVLANASLSGYPSTVNWDVGAKRYGLEKAKERWLGHELFTEIKSNPKIYNEVKKMAREYSGVYWLDNNLCQKLNPPAYRRLQEITAPTLIMIGRDDLTYFKDISRYLHGDIKDSEYEVIANSSHLPNMEKPEIFNNLISSWLTKHKG